MLRAGGASVVRQDPDAIADREVRQRATRTWPYRDDPVLLVRIRNDQVRIRLAGDVAHHAVALVDILLACAPVLRHGHPARIDEDPALLALMPNDRRENRDR